MKKFTFLVIAMMLSFGAAMAQDFYVGDVGYSRSGANGGVKVWGSSTAFAGGAFNIPTSVVDPADSKTYNVTEVRAYFIGKFDYAKRPTSVTVPEGVVTFTAGLNGSFDASAGGAADILESLTLPSTLTLTSFPAYTFRITNVVNPFTSFTIKMATPPTVVATTFYNVNLTHLTIHIPAGKTAAYAAAGWNTTTWPGVTIVEEAGGATVPDPPTGVSAVPGDAQASVSFTAPANNGGSAITGYTVTSSPGSITQGGVSSPIIVSGLTNGTEYTFTVVATNAIGNSAPSAASAPVTPVAPTISATTSIWNGATSSDWFTVSNWTNNPVDANVPPIATTDVSIPVVATNYPTITALATCNNITIASGASLIDENNYLSVSGTATVNRTITDATNDKWHLFISPVEESMQASAGTGFEGAYVDGYDETTGAWVRLATDDDVYSDQGYAINYLTGSRDLVFEGTLMSSPVSYTDLSYTPSSAVNDNYGAGWHLVGNPYPCGINPALCSPPTNMNAFAYV